MKKIYSLVLITGFLLLSLGAIAQPPPPPNNPTTSGNVPVGGGAPIGSGTLILLSMAALYGGHKVYALRSTSEEEE